MIQVYVRGVAKKFPIKEGGVLLTAEMNTQNTKDKRRKFVNNAKLQSFEPWQEKIFAKNAKQGWRFFQPDSIDTPTPRSAREAWGGTYNKDDFEKKENRYQKIMIAVVTGILLLLSIM